MDLCLCERQSILSLRLEMTIKEFNLSDCVHTKFLVDNKSTIDLVNRPMSYGSNKHIERKYHFLRDQVGLKRLKIEHCKTELQLTKFLIKPLN